MTAWIYRFPAFWRKTQNLNPLQASFCCPEEVSVVLGLFLSLSIKVDRKLVCGGGCDCCSSSDTVLEGVTIKVSPSRVTEELWLWIGSGDNGTCGAGVGRRRLRVGTNLGRAVVTSSWRIPCSLAKSVFNRQNLNPRAVKNKIRVENKGNFMVT